MHAIILSVKPLLFKVKNFLSTSFLDAIRASRKPPSVLKLMEEIEARSAAEDIVGQLTHETLVFSSTVELRNFAMKKDFLLSPNPGGMVLDFGVGS